MGCAPPPNGGAPFFSAPFVQRPIQVQADPRYVSEPPFRPTNAPAWQPGFFQQQAAAPRRPVIRLKGDDDEPVAKPAAPAAPSRLALPTPAELGLAAAGASGAPLAASIDWTDVHSRLDRLGALSFHQQKLKDGGCSVSFLLPTDQPNRAHQIEAQAASPAEAARLALAQAELWMARK